MSAKRNGLWGDELVTLDLGNSLHSFLGRMRERGWIEQTGESPRDGSAHVRHRITSLGQAAYLYALAERDA